MLKLLSETREGVRALAHLRLVTFGGSACPEEVGERLVQAGVRLAGHYGLTEVGQLMTSFRNFDEDKGWRWVRASGKAQQYLSWEDRDAGSLELVVKPGWPAMVRLSFLCTCCNVRKPRLNANNPRLRDPIVALPRHFFF